MDTIIAGITTAITTAAGARSSGRPARLGGPFYL
jgi:hypothetical protein